MTPLVPRRAFTTAHTKTLILQAPSRDLPGLSADAAVLMAVLPNIARSYIQS